MRPRVSCLTAKMQTIVYDGPGRVRMQDVPKPTLEAPTDALVRVTTASICASDIHLIHAEGMCQPGTSLGHECVGTIEALGDAVAGFEVGDRVVVSCTIQCGECHSCKNGLYAKCVKGGLFGHGPMLGNHGGGQSDYVRVPYADFTLAKIPDGLSDESVLFVSDILSTAFMAVERGNIRPGDSVAVFGAGPVGLCAVASAHLFSPAHIIAVDPIEQRLGMARTLGATETIDPRKTESVSRIRELTPVEGDENPLMPKGGADVAIEAVGIEATLLPAFEAVRPGGHVSIIGVFTEAQTLPMPLLGVKNITVSMDLVNMVSMARLIEFIEEGALDLRPLITHTMPLSEGVRAYEIFEGKLENVLKIALKP